MDDYLYVYIPMVLFLWLKIGIQENGWLFICIYSYGAFFMVENCYKFSKMGIQGNGWFFLLGILGGCPRSLHYTLLIGRRLGVEKFSSYIGVANRNTWDEYFIWEADFRKW